MTLATSGKNDELLGEDPAKTKDKRISSFQGRNGSIFLEELGLFKTTQLDNDKVENLQITIRRFFPKRDESFSISVNFLLTYCRR